MTSGSRHRNIMPAPAPMTYPIRYNRVFWIFCFKIGIYKYIANWKVGSAHCVIPNLLKCSCVQYTQNIGLGFIWKTVLCKDVQLLWKFFQDGTYIRKTRMQLKEILSRKLFRDLCVVNLNSYLGSSPFKRQYSLRLDQLPSTLERQQRGSFTPDLAPCGTRWTAGPVSTQQAPIGSQQDPITTQQGSISPQQGPISPQLGHLVSSFLLCGM